MAGCLREQHALVACGFQTVLRMSLQMTAAESVIAVDGVIAVGRAVEQQLDVAVDSVVEQPLGDAQNKDR